MVMATLARFRVALGFVFGVLVLVLAQPTGRSLAVGMSIAALGEAVRIWAAGHLRKSREVTVSGPYRWVAHPLYVGSSVMGLGLAIAAASAPVAVLIAIYLGATALPVVSMEWRRRRPSTSATTAPTTAIHVAHAGPPWSSV